jgi:hypothetical protein
MRSFRRRAKRAPRHVESGKGNSRSASDHQPEIALAAMLTIKATSAVL